MALDVRELLDLTIKSNASDLHLLSDIPPVLRIDGELSELNTYQSLNAENIETMMFSLLRPEQKELLLANKQLDFTFGYGKNTKGDLGRFRINVYYERSFLAAAFRYLPPIIRTIEQLNLPSICHQFTELRQGFILVTGPTGQGKSTTLAAILDEINQKRACHILTIEDPIEYVYTAGKSIVSQREMSNDTHSWPLALRAALREDPDVVLIGEMRDTDTIQAALTIAETGHLVFSTLHTNSASQTVDRIVDSFPSHARSQVRVELASMLKGVISQRLLPRIGEGRIPATEILLGTPAVASNIREGKSHLIDSIMQTSKDVGMITMEQSLAQLVKEGMITFDTAKSYSLRESELVRLLS